MFYFLKSIVKTISVQKHAYIVLGCIVYILNMRVNTNLFKKGRSKGRGGWLKAAVLHNVQLFKFIQDRSYYVPVGGGGGGRGRENFPNDEKNSE